MFRVLLRMVIVAGVTGCAILFYRPWHDGFLRYGLPLSLLACWIPGALLLERPRLRLAWLALPMVPAILFMLPGKTINTAELRDRYVSGMIRMNGCRYLWGGESRRGIDCSGLPRRALRDALIETGLRDGNGDAFREWARQWWFDTSAKSMGLGYRGFTRPLGMSGKMSDLDSARLVPGDLAVTEDGRHVMVFLADGKWIQANPMEGKVMIGMTVEDRNPWARSPVTLHRWMLLDD